MNAFIWDQRFTTGIPLVDTQHQKLVEITNRLGERLMQGNHIPEEELQPLFQELAQYGRQHFADEERLMGEAGIDRRHLDAHVGHHRQFVEQLVSLWRGRHAMARPAETIHGFLAAWLTVHILGEDQAMARQLRALQAGEVAENAFAAEQQPADSSTAILLEALQRLYALLSDQNRNLAEINQHLEARVEARTRELSEALARMDAAQQQLLQSEKMAAIGQLAAGVAHEINNPVGFVNSNLGTLKTYMHRLLGVIEAYEQVEAGADRAVLEAARRTADLDFLRQDLPDLLAESQEGLSRVTKIVQDLKDFSRVDQADRQEADLNAALESTLNVVWNELKYKAEVVRELGDLPPVTCVPAQINQVFMNLLVNAAQAIEKTGRITLRSGRAGDAVWFEVEDTGKGMPEEIRRRVFEPFFTTKPVGKGTGLGLSISYDIIKKHGGQFEVRSEPGCGSCFRFTLPLVPPLENDAKP